MIRVYVDANVFLEVLLRRARYEEAAALLKAGEQHHIQLYTSASIVGFMAYWIHKDLGFAKTKALLLELLQFIRILDISHEQLLEALRSEGKDIEDSIQYFTALQHGMDYLATFNEKDFRKLKGSVQVALPQEILKLAL